MENFLIHLAIIKVNWDRSEADLLDNYVPLIGYAIKQCDGDLVSQQQIVAKLSEVAEFTIPQAAVHLLIRRAAKPRYAYITRTEHNVYRRNNVSLDALDYIRIRDEQIIRHRQLKRQFQEYCAGSFADVPAVEI